MKGQDGEMLKKCFLTEQERDQSIIFKIDAYNDCKLMSRFGLIRSPEELV